ncbi:dimethylallyl tryptophan synthase GliD1 [Diaporthe helianthi]|uniref:Dimethylallyl tryptophan synthase GliD1 n=1 Tax=Diaporthe helianthi TaxID=158607 RepID=A0A2P5HFX3_DIAHE|nr:dimethylallyl tryptophan synthase GliD1 [Diaporthe helianthi]
MAPEHPKSDPGMVATTVWPSVSKWLPPRDEHSNYWWGLAGPHLAVLLHNSGYSRSSQYEVLLFIYHHIVPRLGLAPRFASTEDGLSSVEQGRIQFLGHVDGRTERLEYSWRWPDPEGKPEIRIGVKPWCRFAGTAIDPLNLMAPTELLSSMTAQVPCFDLTLFHHFILKLYDAEKNKYVSAKELQGLPWVCATGFEFLGHDILPKVYFFPWRLGHGDTLPLEVWEEALTSAPMRVPALHTVDYPPSATPTFGPRKF